jgi:hypothetical protein
LSDPRLFKILSDDWAVRDEQHPAIYLERGLWRVIYLDNGAGGVGGGVCEASYKTLREAMHLYSEKYGR